MNPSRPFHTRRIANIATMLGLGLGAISAITPALADPSPAALPWTHADFIRFTPATFRKHLPAQRVMDQASPDLDLLCAAIFYASNMQRIERGLPTLGASEALGRCAQWHSKSMAVHSFFSHDNLHVPAMRTPWRRMAAVGVGGGFRSENIASCGISGLTYLAAADRVVDMWMKSPGHRANLLDRRVRYLGCGAYPASGRGFQLLATQNFSSDLPVQSPVRSP